MAFCGIDVGTQGARCILVDEGGKVLGEGQCPLRSPAVPGLPEGWFEQRPDDWLEAAARATREAVGRLGESGAGPGAVRAVGVTSTSGTLCALDPQHRPLCPAIMYSDSRSSQEAAAAQDRSEQHDEQQRREGVGYVHRIVRDRSGAGRYLRGQRLRRQTPRESRGYLGLRVKKRLCLRLSRMRALMAQPEPSRMALRSRLRSFRKPMIDVGTVVCVGIDKQW